MSRFGKCQNLSGCLLAYRGEETEVENDQPFICAECGKPLTEVKSPSAFWMRYVFGLLAIVVLVGVAVAFVPSLRGLIVRAKGHDKGEATPAPIVDSEPGTGNGAVVSSGNGSGTTPEPAEPKSPPPDEPPRFMTAPSRLEMDVAAQENKAVKAEVLTRIDLMPNVTPADKDRLYNAVEKARKMGKVLTIPFGSGKTDLTEKDVQQLKAELDKPEIASMRSREVTLVFVILGYADPKGDPKKNIAYSQTRADAVLKAMRDKCNVKNVMHTVAMGGSKLLDSENLEKNRIVEIWAVIP